MTPDTQDTVPLRCGTGQEARCILCNGLAAKDMMRTMSLGRTEGSAFCITGIYLCDNHPDDPETTMAAAERFWLRIGEMAALKRAYEAPQKEDPCAS